MIARVRQRVSRVRDSLIQKHLDLLLLLLAEQGADQTQQRDRADVLVRCLTNAQLEATLFDQGRRIPLALDTTSAVPKLTLNAELLARLQDDEILALFGRPIAELLQLPPINVGLVLQGHDEKQLRNLYHSARGKVTQPIVRAASVRSVIEHHVTTFSDRLRRVVQSLADQQRLELGSPAAFIGWLESCKGSWPEWIDVGQEDFIKHAIQRVGALLPKDSSLPTSDIIVEMCWESLTLSPQSFLRQVGRDLRARDVAVSEELLRVFGRVVASQEISELESLDGWPSLRDLNSAWEELAALEIQTLGHHLLASSAIPKISVLAAPADSMSLREPEGLPWRYPLVCWSLRETNALRDLLQGFVQTQRNDMSEESEFEMLLVEAPEQEAPLVTDQPVKHLQMQVVGTTIDMPPGYDVMSERAFESVLSRLETQVSGLPPAQRMSALHRIRGSYDGFFMNTRHVWQRRLQGWKLDEIPMATRRLAGEVGALLDCPVIFDPFESPHGSEIRMMPTFVFVVAISPHLEKAPFHIPISTLVMTAATGTPPLRVRMIEVPGDPSEPCRWLGDKELTMETMMGQPVQTTLNAVENNKLRMIAMQ